MDGIFYWTGKGLNWDVYGHNRRSSDPLAKLPCTPDANGYNTGAPTAINYYEWCQDHNKPRRVEAIRRCRGRRPGDAARSEHLRQWCLVRRQPLSRSGRDRRAVGTTPIPPSGTVANHPTDEAGFAFMWHSHNEREITTNNIFPGGMMMMMLVDSREFVIDESM